MEKRNLYDYSIPITYKDGDISLERIVKDIPDNINDRSHIIVEGDTLENLAYFYYKDNRRWFLLADKNNIDDIFNLEIGTELIIPDIKSIL